MKPLKSNKDIVIVIKGVPSEPLITKKIPFGKFIATIDVSINC